MLSERGGSGVPLTRKQRLHWKMRFPTNTPMKQGPCANQMSTSTCKSIVNIYDHGQQNSCQRHNRCGITVTLRKATLTFVELPRSPGYFPSTQASNSFKKSTGSISSGLVMSASAPAPASPSGNACRVCALSRPPPPSAAAAANTFSASALSTFVSGCRCGWSLLPGVRTGGGGGGSKKGNWCRDDKRACALLLETSYLLVCVKDTRLSLGYEVWQRLLDTEQGAAEKVCSTHPQSLTFPARGLQKYRFL